MYFLGTDLDSAVRDKPVPDLPTPITCKSGGFEKKPIKKLEIRT